MNFLNISITKKISFFILMLCIISISGMMISLVIVDNIQGRTHIVNQIGSIRMLIYKSISPAENKIFSENVSIITSRLNDPQIKEYMIESGLNREHNELINFFHTKIESGNINSIKLNAEEFVEKTNILIDKVEQNTENNIKSLENIQK
ncbi:sensor histidine kinase, partial [Vibrio navarrensis]|nr:sensor histidine kinase [Vibrio navarrensis]